MGLIKLIKNYKKLGHEEFMKRWKEGISKVSQTQQTKASFSGHFFIFIGIITGLYITFRTKTYWLTLILFGTLILESIAVFGNYQKYLLLKHQDELMNQIYSQDASTRKNEGVDTGYEAFKHPEILKAEKIE